MCWGDVKLCQTFTGQQYLEFNEYAEKRPAEMKTDQPSPQAFSLDSLSARSLGKTGREN